MDWCLISGGADLWQAAGVVAAEFSMLGHSDFPGGSNTPAELG